MRDLKETLETIAVAWASLALIPFADFIDIPVILLFSNLLNLTYAQMAGIYYISAFLVLILLAPKKLKVIYNKIKRWF